MFVIERGRLRQTTVIVTCTLCVFVVFTILRLPTGLDGVTTDAAPHT